MEQSIGNNKKGHGPIWSTMLTEKESQVVQILVELPRMILDLEAARRLPFTWGCKRKRSAIQVRVTPRAAPRRLSTSPTPLHHGGGDGGGAVVRPPCDAESLAAVKAKASSPATPLSFSPTESDEKPKPLRTKASLKRKREYYLKIIEDLTKSKASLNQEIDNVKRYCGQLKAFNLKLKARKQELRNGPKSECKHPSSEIGRQMQLVHAWVNSSNSMAENEQQQKQQHQLQLQMSSTPHYLPLMLNQTPWPSSQICNSEGVAQFQYVSGHSTTSLPMPSSSSSSTSALGMVNSNMGPLAIPDLNLSPEEFIQVDSCVTTANKDLSRAMAAQARQRRIQIYRLKNSIGNSKPRYSYR